MAAAGSALEAIKAKRDQRPASPQASEEDSLDSEDGDTDEEERKKEEPRTPVKDAGVSRAAARAKEKKANSAASSPLKKAVDTLPPPSSKPANSKEALKTLLGLRKSVPFTADQAKEAERLILMITSRDLEEAGLAAPPRPKLPPHVERIPIKNRLLLLQEFISSFEYNHTDKQYFNLLKNRPMARVMDTAKEIIRKGLPIKCLEAVFLGLYLTSGMNELDRIPVGFKTQAEGNTYRHIVLVIKHRPTNTYGALGLSRRTELMYKELKYTTLAAVLTDYKTSYEGWWHKVEKMRVGLAVTHDTFSNNPICWRYFCYKTLKGKWERHCTEIDQHAESNASTKLYEKWLIHGEKYKKPKRRNPEWKVDPKASVAKKESKKAPVVRCSPTMAEAKEMARAVLADSPYAQKFPLRRSSTEQPDIPWGRSHFQSAAALAQQPEEVVSEIVYTSGPATAIEPTSPVKNTESGEPVHSVDLNEAVEPVTAAARTSSSENKPSASGEDSLGDPSSEIPVVASTVPEDGERGLEDVEEEGESNDSGSSSNGDSTSDEVSDSEAESDAAF